MLVLAEFQSGHNCGLNSKKYLADILIYWYTKYSFFRIGNRYVFSRAQNQQKCTVSHCTHPSSQFLLLKVRKKPSTALWKKNYCLFKSTSCGSMSKEVDAIHSNMHRIFVSSMHSSN